MQVDDAGPTERTRDDGLPRPPRFFGRRAWYRRRLETLAQEAVIDDLTGLRNQRALWRELSRRAPLCSAAEPLTLVMLDFDLFAQVNERHGHALGDAILTRGAAAIREAAASPRLAFRYGGDEAVVLVPGREEKGSELAERVRSRIADEQHRGLPLVTLSCGVAELDSPVEPWVALDRVDAALREAKRTGRDRVVVAGQTDNTASTYLVEDREHETARRAALALAVATLQVRHRQTADHSDDVLMLCEEIGQQLGFDARALERLTAGAHLHDIGKVAIPSGLLNKPGELDDDERKLIRKHTILGERILRSVPEMAEVATIVRHSHEHWDGGGYPDGLSGEQIPLPSRVILCADAFHAIRSDRPYRVGRPARDALQEVRACAGTQFDPVVVDALGTVAAKARSGVGGPLRRNKRLVLLLTALALAGTSVAAVPALRDAVRSLFGATTAKPGAFADEPGWGFTLGSLGQRLSIQPGAVGVRDERPRDTVRNPPRTTRARDVPRSARGGLDKQPAREARAPGTPAPTRDSTDGTTRTLAGPGVYCRAESTRKVKGQARSDFSICVTARAKLLAR